MDKKGQALVEMAIVLVLLFLLVFGIFQFGWLMYIKNTLNNSARAAARTAVVTPSLNTSSDTAYNTGSFPNDCSGITDPVQQKICDSLNYVNKPDVSATITSSHHPAQSGDTVTVAVTLGNVRPFVPNFISLGFLQADTNNSGAYLIKGQASMRYE
jgi:Flp pilus assembly protein TadG